jgi:RNA recognition motif-containing protein
MATSPNAEQSETPEPSQSQAAQPASATAPTGAAMQKIHVGNLAATSSESGVRALFATHGAVSSYERPIESATKKPAGFAFVEMAQADAAKAIAALNGTQLDGQALRVSEAKPRS